MAIKHVETLRITDGEAAELGQMETQAVNDSDPEKGSTMIAMRWGRPQLRMVRRAAELRGVPYQIYIKNAAWEMARQDLEQAAALSQS